MVFAGSSAFSQNTDNPFIKLQEPAKEKNAVKASRQFIVGATCKTCSLTINGQAAKVYPTGAFAYEVNLKPGDSSFNMIAFAGEGKSFGKKISYNYSLPSPPDTIKTLDIAGIETFPEGNLYVQAGDKIKIRVRHFRDAV